MFGKNQDILDEVTNTLHEVKQVRKSMSNLATNVASELNNIKAKQEILNIKVDKILALLSNEDNQEDNKSKGLHLKFPYVYFNFKPSVPEYKMSDDETNNDLLTQGSFKHKINFTIKSTEIDLNKVDWNKSYMLLSFRGMDDYCLTLRQNNRSFTKFSDYKDSLKITKLSKLVLCLGDKYLDIDLDLYSYDDMFDNFITEADGGKDWNYTKFVLNLDLD